MTNTTYYNLNIVEGSDIVNPLTVDNPNYEKIDETMHNNAVSGVTLATEISNATVHAITRENSECAVIRFIATSVWKAGDTITVDGVPVTALLPSGETLPDGAYVINANVLCILTGTNMTVFVERKKTDNANDIKYNSTNVGAELDKVNSNLRNLSLSNTFSIMTGSTTSEHVILPYPEGFNFNNCFIVSFMVKYDTNAFSYFNSYGTNIELKSDGIYIIVSNSMLCQRPAYVVLGKIE